MEIVIIEDLVASYRTNWVRIAKTTDADALHIGHVLRRRGNGSGSEELEVEAISDGRVFLKRGHGPTPVEVHFHGSVFTVLGAKPQYVSAGGGGHVLVGVTVRNQTHLTDGPSNPTLGKSAYTPEMRRANLAKARAAKAEKRQGAGV